MTAKSFSILNNPVTAAQLLLGSLIIREVDGRELIGKIVETEAYDQQDAASNSYQWQNTPNGCHVWVAWPRLRLLHIRYALLHEYCHGVRGLRFSGADSGSGANKGN